MISYDTIGYNLGHSAKKQRSAAFFVSDDFERAEFDHEVA